MRNRRSRAVHSRSSAARLAGGEPTMSKPLDGLRVIDFSRQMAGPYAGVVLADFGADVVKVETLPHGDPSRRTGVALVGDQSAFFLMWNRGKRSIALDMRRPEGLEIVQELIA